MPVDMRPTLVIGLGGTGSEIAERVYLEGKALGLVEQRRLFVLGLDTSDYDHQRRQLSPTGKVRFSTSKTIDQLLQRNPDAEGVWFYRRDELPAPIRNMTLLEGAGQLRMLTRLALHDEFSHGSLANTLRSSLEGLTRVTNRDFKGQLNVLIIGSLAGGTGCGSFLPVALAVRELAPLGTDVRGLFLLPDVFVHGGGLARDQIANVRTNGMSALRELNAVMEATSHDQRLIEVLNFEFMPRRGLRFGTIPYDQVTLIDYEMTNGQTLGPNLDHYKNLMARVAFNQLFLPLGQEVDNRTVNSVKLKLQAASKGQSNSYSSMGIFAVTYPEDAIVDHLTSRFASEVLEGDWLVLDRTFRGRVENYEQRRRAGDLSAIYPDRNASFIDDLDQFARDRRPLFLSVYENVFHEERQPDGNVVTKVAHLSFLEAFENYVRDQFRTNSESLREAYRVERVSIAQFEERDDLPDIVRRNEGRLDNVWRIFQDAARQVPDSLYENFWAGGLTMSAAEWQSHHVQKYLIAPAPHLVEVRYFLYLTLREIEKRLGQLKPEESARLVVEASSAFGRKGEKRKQAPEGRRAGPGPLDEATEVAEVSFVRKMLLPGDRKQFAHKYYKYFNDSLDVMQRYAEEEALKRCLERLRNSLNDLKRLMELLFGDLEELQNKLKVDIETDLGRHERVAGAQSGNRYVYAGAAAKDAMWNVIKPEVQGQHMSREANSTLVAALFNEVRRQQTDRFSSGPGQAFSIRDLFVRTVIDGFCRKMLRDDLGTAYSFNVAQAIRKEADLLHADYRTHLSGLVKTIANQSKPFIQVIDDEGSEFTYWAMHPDTKRDIGSLFDDVFKYGESVNAVDAEEYDRRALLCVDVKFSLPLTSLAKLQAGIRQTATAYDKQAGLYENAYREEIENLYKGDAGRGSGRTRSTLSPHLDRQWHLPHKLPEIFQSVGENQIDTFYQDFVIALGLGFLVKETEAGDPVVVFYDPTQHARGGNRTIVTAGHAIDRLFVEFKSYPDFARASRAGFDQALANARASAGRDDYLKSNLYIQLIAPDLMAELLDIGRNRTLYDVDAEVARIVRAYFELLRSFLAVVRVDLDKGARRKLFSETVDQISRSALEKFKTRTENEETCSKVERTVTNVIHGVSTE